MAHTTFPQEWNTPGIYCIRNTDTGKRYIGSSISVKRRLEEHRYELRRGNHANPYLQSSFTTHGEISFEFELVELCDKELLQARESYWIDHFKCYVTQTGYNIQAPYRGPILEDTKRKISKALTGKHRSAESIQKGINTRRGYRHSEETKAKIRQSNLGKKRSPDTVARMSATAKGRMGELNGFYGKRHSEKTLKILSEKNGDNTRGKKWMTNGIHSIRVNEEDINMYETQGYKLGRGGLKK